MSPHPSEGAGAGANLQLCRGRWGPEKDVVDGLGEVEEEERGDEHPECRHRFMALH